MYEEINGDLFITEDNRLIIKSKPMFVLECERIWNADQIERQNRIDELELKSLPNKVKMKEIQNLFDEREKEYNSRLVKDGTISATKWLESQKKTV